MLLKLSTQHFKKVLEYKRTVKICLLATALFLLDLKLKPNRLSAQNLLCEDLEYNGKIRYLMPKDDFYKIRSPCRTILIVCDEPVKTKYGLVYGSLRDLKTNKEIVCTFKQSIQCSKYFTVINLSLNNQAHTKIFPLSIYQPNSDLLYISSFYFPVQEIYAKPHIDLLNYPYTINIQINDTLKDTKIFCTLLRTLSNIDSYDDGQYFYIPFGTSNLNIMQLFPFCILTFICMLIDWIVFYNEGSLCVMLHVFLFYIEPFTGIITLFHKKVTPFLLLIYFFIDFRIGFCLFSLVYISQIYNLVN